MAGQEARENVVFQDMQGPREKQVNRESRVSQEKKASLGHLDLKDCLGLQEEM